MIIEFPIPCGWCMQDLNVAVDVALAEQGDRDVSMRILSQEYERALLHHMFAQPTFRGVRHE